MSVARATARPSEPLAESAPSGTVEEPSVASLSARLGGIPVEMLLTTLRGPVRLELDPPVGDDLQEASFRVDGKGWVRLHRAEAVWRGDVHAEGLTDGVYELEIRVRRMDGAEEVIRSTFRVRNNSI